MSQNSALYQISKAGTLAIPKLAKVLKLVKSKGGNVNQELPIQLKIGDEFTHHNMFICPVTKEISDKENPPMLLKCGHCMSK
jgi:hypothetical protein